MSGIAKVDHTGNVRVLKTFFMPGPKMHLLNSYPKVRCTCIYQMKNVFLTCMLYLYYKKLLQEIHFLHFLSKMHLRTCIQYFGKCYFL